MINRFKKFFITGILSFFLLNGWAKPVDLSHAAGQMMMVGFLGKTIDENSDIVKEIKNYHIGGVILCDHNYPDKDRRVTNIENPPQLKELIAQLQFFAKKYHDYPLFISINQEGGLVNALKPRQGFATANDPSQAQLGEDKNKALLFDTAYQRGKMLKQLGININLAPVADLNLNPTNPAVGKYQRSFGAQASSIISDLRLTIKAYKKAGILCTLKHFPGLGSANANTDYTKVDVTLVYQNQELLPYQTLIQSHSACPLIMPTHLINTNLDKEGLPASLSKKIVTGLLIDKMHYKGLIITDDMDAAAIRKYFKTDDAIEKAVLAGNNILIYGGTQGQNPTEDADVLYKDLMLFAKENKIFRQRVFASYYKIKQVKKRIR